MGAAESSRLSRDPKIAQRKGNVQERRRPEGNIYRPFTLLFPLSAGENALTGDDPQSKRQKRPVLPIAMPARYCYNKETGKDVHSI
jgi:hypothetical protein